MNGPSAINSSGEYFDSVAADWDRLRERLFPKRVRDVALAVAGVCPDGTAVDVGAGTGFLTEGLLARGARVIAVESSTSMLEVLRRKFPWAGRVDCREGDAERLPIADESVDCCLANMLLHHVARPAVAVREMARVVKPGGKVVITDLDAHDFAFLRDEHHDRWMGFERQSLLAWLRDAGLADIRVEDIGEDCCSTSCSGELAAVGILIASGVKPIAGEARRRTLSRCLRSGTAKETRIPVRHDQSGTREAPRCHGPDNHRKGRSRATKGDSVDSR